MLGDSRRARARNSTDHWPIVISACRGSIQLPGAPSSVHRSDDEGILASSRCLRGPGASTQVASGEPRSTWSRKATRGRLRPGGAPRPVAKRIIALRICSEVGGSGSGVAVCLAATAGRKNTTRRLDAAGASSRVTRNMAACARSTSGRSSPTKSSRSPQACLAGDPFS